MMRLTGLAGLASWALGSGTREPFICWLWFSCKVVPNCITRAWYDHRRSTGQRWDEERARNGRQKKTVQNVASRVILFKELKSILCS
ncbi:hypothetical protein BDQ17DRAFT_1377406 [Cyathus striatus]|nr:hypothetical protein BDQ17DRAFT_1377406 [Cyathus striatus]